MRKFARQFLLFCGIACGLAAFPVYGQQTIDGEINKKPLVDFAVYVNALRAENVKLDRSFVVELEGALTKDGKFDAGKTRFVRMEGDRQIVEIAQKSIMAVSDAGWLIYLRHQGIEQIKATVGQDDQRFAVKIASNLPTPQRAKTIGTGLSGVIYAALLLDKNGVKKLGDDEKKLLNGVNVTTEEKSVIINFSLPKADFQEMIERKLREAKTNE